MSSSDEFFVGWLKTPRSYVPTLVAASALIVGVTVLAAIALPVAQQSPGSGRWNTNREVTLVGRVTAHPYAMLFVVQPDEKKNVATHLLVRCGKFGARELVTPFEGQVVQARGYLLDRDGRRMLELIDNGLRPADGFADSSTKAPVPVAQSLGAVTRQGEIIDPKCYLGAMKPGGGKTHKACASLCIRGGVPPMLVTRDAGQRETYYLLTDVDGGPLGESILPLVADQVTVSGVVHRVGDLLELRLDVKEIRRR